MLFIVKLLKTLKLYSLLKDYKKFKRQSISNKNIKYSCSHRLKKCIKRKIPFWCGGFRNTNPQGCCGQYCLRVTTYGTLHNYLCKSLIGFLSGLFITFSIFFFFTLPLNMSLPLSTFYASIIGISSTVLLAFSESARAIMLMLLPQLFTAKGRQAMTTYVLILAFSGPVKNAILNIKIISDSMACTQEKANGLLHAVVDLIKQPFLAIKQSIASVMERVKVVVGKTKTMLKEVKRIILSILGIISSAFEWLNGIIGMCSKKVGTPFQRCMRAFDSSIDDCMAKLGSWFNWMCAAAYIASALCYVVKVLDFICDAVEFISEELIITTKRKMKKFFFMVRNMFYVEAEVKFQISYSMNKSREVSDVFKAIAKDYSKCLKRIFGWLDAMSFIFSIFMFYCVYSVYRYRKKFLTREWFENRFLTDDLLILEYNRVKQRKETIFPLTRAEKMKYRQLGTLKLFGKERVRMIKLMVTFFWLISKVLIAVGMDLCVWWITLKVKKYSNQSMGVDGIGNIKVNVNETGAMSEVYAGIANSFQPQGLSLDFDTAACAPDARPPMYHKYAQIGVLTFFILLFSVFQPYGQRLRVLIMNYYYPAVARRRAIWLYNHILRSRGSFLKYARRLLRRKYGGANSSQTEKITCGQRMLAVCPCFTSIFHIHSPESCMMCATPGSPEEPLLKCSTPNCPGVYCAPCFQTLQNTCTLCQSPISYGDLSDIDEEMDSSDLERKQSPQLKIILVSDLESSDELDYDYQQKQRDPFDRPDITPSIDKLEGQRLSNEYANTDDYDLSDNGKRENNWLRSVSRSSLKERRGSSILESTVKIDETLNESHFQLEEEICKPCGRVMDKNCDPCECSHKSRILNQLNKIKQLCTIKRNKTKLGDVQVYRAVNRLVPLKVQLVLEEMCRKKIKESNIDVEQNADVAPLVANIAEDLKSLPTEKNTINQKQTFQLTSQKSNSKIVYGISRKPSSDSIISRGTRSIINLALGLWSPSSPNNMNITRDNYININVTDFSDKESTSAQPIRQAYFSHRWRTRPTRSKLTYSPTMSSFSRRLSSTSYLASTTSYYKTDSDRIGFREGSHFSRLTKMFSSLKRFLFGGSEQDEYVSLVSSEDETDSSDDTSGETVIFRKRRIGTSTSSTDHYYNSHSDSGSSSSDASNITTEEISITRHSSYSS